MNQAEFQEYTQACFFFFIDINYLTVNWYGLIEGWSIKPEYEGGLWHAPLGINYDYDKIGTIKDKALHPKDPENWLFKRNGEMED